VPARLGNGDDPESNLYWGAAFGVKAFFGKRPDWRAIQQITSPGPGVLQRCIFRHRNRDVFIIADAYQGLEIKRATGDFLRYAAGVISDIVNPPVFEGLTLDGPADLAVYIGHDGLMDFRLPEYPRGRDGNKTDAMVLCCASKAYFSDAIRASGARPVLLTTGLMAPEAYVLDAVLTGWISGEGADRICARAATAYNQYQKCGYRAARALFTTEHRIYWLVLLGTGIFPMGIPPGICISL
jgi:hypothetical protein